MRWSIIRLIWLRELRDQLRDRRTIFTIVALPVLMYPLLSFVVIHFASQLLERESIVGVVQGDADTKTFPKPPSTGQHKSVAAPLSWLTLTPTVGRSPMDSALSAFAASEWNRRTYDFPLLIENDALADIVQSSPINRAPVFPGKIQLRFQFLSGDGKSELANKRVDLLLSAPDDFMESVVNGGRPKLSIAGRANDDRSRRAAEQVGILLGRWRKQLKEVRLQREGFPPTFDQPFRIEQVGRPESEDLIAAETILDLMVRTFPFLLVMWSLVGALHPAIDLCAGEKERGTMETLLISPAGRAEIVYGKFLTIWVFSAGTSVLHLISMSISTWQLREQLPQGAVTLTTLLWCFPLVLPLAALFSAICLSIGAYARSTKEGQYYLMPLFWLIMPLALVTFSPDVELNQFWSMVPVTGVALLMQRLMLAPSLDSIPWFYFLPVFGSIVLWSWLALRWAIWQFQREEVLFRSAERLHLGLMIRQLFRRREASPSLGQALFCFVVLFLLRRLSLNLDDHYSLVIRNAVVLIAFVGAPVLFMGMLMATHVQENLRLRWPHIGYTAAALLFLPMAETAHHVLLQFPALADLFHERRQFIEQNVRADGSESVLIWLHYLLILGVLSAVCKEIAFRGFILSGLRHRLSVWPAILLSSLLFAVWHMNVFTLAPLFALGVVTGWLAQRSGSLVPGIVLHTGCNLLLLRGALLADSEATTPVVAYVLLPATALLCAIVVGVLFWKLPPFHAHTAVAESNHDRAEK